jgi:hypothetical protein
MKQNYKNRMKLDRKVKDWEEKNNKKEVRHQDE